MVIRRATSKELQMILDYSPTVMKEATMGFVEGSKEVAFQMMSQVLVDGGYYLVYIQHNVIQGWIGVGHCYNLYTDNKEGMISELYVLPQYRQKGIADKLLEHACKRLIKAGFKKIQLQVFTGNHAKSLYEKHGFYDVSTVMEKNVADEKPVTQHK